MIQFSGGGSSMLCRTKRGGATTLGASPDGSVY